MNTKEEADNKFLSKENIINEENYSRTDKKTSGIFKNGFWFSELFSSEDLRVGFVFNYYDILTPTNLVPIITHKYSFVERIDDAEPYDYYLSEDKQ